jgi:heavy metal sensor kinase
MAAAASAIVGAFRFTRGLRFRIAVGYVVFFTILLCVLGVVFRKSLQNIFLTQTQDLLEDDWEAAKGYLRIDAGPDWFFDRKDSEDNFIGSRLQRVYVLADSEGHPLNYSPIYASFGFDDPAYVKSIVNSGRKAFRTRYDPQRVPYMVISGVRSDQNHHKYFFSIGRPIANNLRALDQFTLNYFLIMPLAILVSSVLGWFLAGRALSPVNRVAQTAELITHSNLNMRLLKRGARDELDRFIDSFNRMMERLHLSFEQMRQFSTDVSHELRTPLTVIRGQLEVALFTANTVEQYKDAMVNALEDVERLSNIVRALLMLSQAESGQLTLNRTDMDLPEMVRDLAEQYQIVAEATNVQLSYDGPEQPCNIHADRVQMERLITNLLSNAIKYTPAGGHVSVRISSNSETATLTVEDDGVGIASENLPHIFDRFYRVPSTDPEKGLGLGLSFVAWIVKAHGGSIDVQSELQKGTRFAVTLPAGATSPRLETAEECEASLNAPEQPNPGN